MPNGSVHAASCFSHRWHDMEDVLRRIATDAVVAGAKFGIFGAVYFYNVSWGRVHVVVLVCQLVPCALKPLAVATPVKTMQIPLSHYPFEKKKDYNRCYLSHRTLLIRSKHHA